MYAGNMDDLIEARGDGPFLLWSEVREFHKELRQAIYDARPRFVVEGTELDDVDLVACREVSVQVQSWEDWRTIWKDLDDHGTVTSDFELHEQKVKEGFHLKDGLTDWLEFKSTSNNVITQGCHIYRLHVNDTSFHPSGWKESGWGAWLCAPEDAVTFAENPENNLIIRTFRWRPKELCVDRPGGEKWPVIFNFALKLDGSTTKVTIPDVVDRIESLSSREVSLPGGPACYRAARQIVREAQQRWQAPATSCVEMVCETLETRTDSVIDTMMSSYPELKKKVKHILRAKISELKDKLIFRSTELLDRHEGAPDLFTQNDHYLKDSFDNAQRIIRSKLGCTLKLHNLTKEEQQALSMLAIKARHDPSKLIALDPRDDAIWCMAAAFAYHKVAFKRFCDALPRTVDEILLRDFVKSIREVLLIDLRVMDADNEQLCPWFVEDAGLNRCRQELQTKIARQKQGLQLLDNAWGKCSPACMAIPNGADS